VTDGLKAVPFKAQLSKHNSQSSYHLKAAIISKQLSKDTYSKRAGEPSSLQKARRHGQRRTASSALLVPKL